MLVLRYFECLWILASVTFAAKVISEDTVTLDRNELGYEITDLTINPGVFWSILGNVVATFKGNLNIGKDGDYLSPPRPTFGVSISDTRAVLLTIKVHLL